MLVRVLASLDQSSFDVLSEEGVSLYGRRGPYIRIIDIAVEADLPAHRYLQLVLQNPEERPGLGHLGYYVRAHCGAGCRDHPAVLFTAGDLMARLSRDLAIEDFVPRLSSEIAHAQIGPHVAGPHVRPRIDEGEVFSCGAGDKPVMTEDLFDKAEIQVGAEPVLRLVTPYHRVDQPLHLAGNGLAFVKIIVVLVELPGVVKG